MTDTVGDRNTGETEGETEGEGTCYVVFFLLYSFLLSTLFISSFPIVYSITIGRAGRGGAGQNVTGPMRERVAARGTRTGGQVGGKRR